MSKKLQDLQAVKVQLDELQAIPFDDTFGFLSKAAGVEELLKKAARCPKSDEEKAMAKEVKEQWKQIQLNFEKFQGEK